MRFSTLFTAALVAGSSSASRIPSRRKAIPTYDGDTPLPLIVWHGLGDSFDGEGIKLVGELANAIHPGTFFYPIALAADGSGDRQATFFGNVTSQLASVCEALSSHPILSTAPAIDAIGFSQGGQFLRAYVERCNDPPVRSLVTFGSQHNGITEFKSCGAVDLLCRAAMALLRHNTWSDAVQARLVPAQYFRDRADEEQYAAYLEHSNFLADVNNERPGKDPRYAENMRRLANFVMYMFRDDSIVIPKETSWFAEVDGDKVTPLWETKAYDEDWIGLKALDRKGRLRFRSIPADHMRIDEGVLNETMTAYFGPMGRSFEPEPKREEVMSDEL